MKQSFRRFRIMWRIELAIAEARLRILLRRFAGYVLAGLVAVLGLCMLNGAAFFGLKPVWGPMRAAVAVGLGDFLLAAAIIAVFALAGKRSPELVLALELRRTEISGMEDELHGLREQLLWLLGGKQYAIDTTLAAILVPLVTAIARGLRKSKPEQK